MSLTTDALAHAKLGHPVLPLKDDKSPRTPHGYKDATTNPAKIKAWPKVEHYGILGRAFIDIDGPDGEETLASLEAELGPLPVTAEQKTPKGRHLLFDGALPSTVAKLGPGIDTRGPNGYIATGKGYTWKRPLSMGFANLPDAWLKRLTGQHKADSSPSEGRSKLAELLADPPEEGRRNDWLAETAGHFAKAHKHRDAYDQLVYGYGREIGLDDEEIKKTADSIWRTEHDKPDVDGALYPLLSIDDLSKLTPPSWLIDGHLPESGFSTVYGPPGVGKSFLVLDWALSVAAGQEWIAYNVKQTPVLYITAEGVSGLYRRIEAWCADRKCKPPANFLALPEAVNLLNDGNVEILRATIASMANPPGLIIADTLARMIEGGDENSAKDVGKAIAVLTRLAKPYDAASMFVHHTTKDGDSERGSTALRGASDMMAVLKPSGAGVSLTCTKMKNWEEFNPFLLNLAKIADSCVFTLGTPDGADSGSETAFIEGVALAFGTRWATAKEMEEVLDMSKRTFFRTRKSLLDRGILEAEDETKRYTRYRLTDD
jgi:DNA-binding transcriptional ArsR family regulator